MRSSAMTRSTSPAGPVIMAPPFRRPHELLNRVNYSHSLFVATANNRLLACQVTGETCDVTVRSHHAVRLSRQIFLFAAVCGPTRLKNEIQVMRQRDVAHDFSPQVTGTPASQGT